MYGSGCMKYEVCIRETMAGILMYWYFMALVLRRTVNYIDIYDGSSKAVIYHLLTIVLTSNRESCFSSWA